MEEIWRDIKGYEGYYQASNLGRVKSLARCVVRKSGRALPLKEKVLKQHFTGKGCYLGIALHHNNKQKTYHIHKLVWDAFGDGRFSSSKLQIDHIDNNKTNNNINNLTLLNPRQNTGKALLRYPKSSKYTGVYLEKSTNRWVSQINLDGKPTKIGRFPTELQAYLAYQKAVISIEGYL